MRWVMEQTRLKGLHCLSAFCPPATAFAVRESAEQIQPVSIAFRRSAPRLLMAPLERALERVQSPLPFGVLPPGYRRTRLKIGNITAASLHCLSAFCPPATTGNCGLRRPPLSGSPLPFGVLPPGYLITDEDLRSGDRVSIAFRRSAPRLPRVQMSAVYAFSGLH